MRTEPPATETALFQAYRAPPAALAPSPCTALTLKEEKEKLVMRLRELLDSVHAVRFTVAP